MIFHITKDDYLETVNLFTLLGALQYRKTIQGEDLGNTIKQVQNTIDSIHKKTLAQGIAEVQ